MVIHADREIHCCLTTTTSEKMPTITSMSTNVISHLKT
jgi:hypothetical protein